MWQVIEEQEYKALKADLSPVAGGLMCPSGNFLEYGRGGQSYTRVEYHFLGGSEATKVYFKWEV